MRPNNNGIKFAAATRATPAPARPPRASAAGRIQHQGKAVSTAGSPHLFHRIRLSFGKSHDDDPVAGRVRQVHQITVSRNGCVERPAVAVRRDAAGYVELVSSRPLSFPGYDEGAVRGPSLRAVVVGVGDGEPVAAKNRGSK